MDTKQLQRIVINALEDVKAQDIQLFDTEHLTSMFDRIVVASGTSNRQAKALAASVRDKVKEAGGKIVSIEGEKTGEWVLVDLGDMVVHIMQPTIRAYYRLEEIWGEKPISLTVAKRAPKAATTSSASKKTGAAKQTATSKTAKPKAADKTAPRATSAKKTATAKAEGKPAAKTAAKKPAASAKTAKTSTAKKAEPAARPARTRAKKNPE